VLCVGVVVIVVVVVVAVVGIVVGVSVTPTAFLLGSVVAENRQIGGVFTTLGAKNTVNTNIFGGSEAQNHGIYYIFCP